ncbi:YolD-like family protein [Fictibacillus sp. WQ 8-8]|uniref:YolD-like family protein n=1 Tax=Fictibacillus sp. WQ 8-8 TaxID=2938788 RepID=UPI002109AE15|nr:YolD-like family protein [Fictibacillus sp. WQ 8-8]MCQ6267889.1 YolD-like family protein [Fictibacillus sp. WQ 8-8]
MFIPEHVKGLREFDWDNKRKVKPELDEQQLELMEETICRRWPRIRICVLPTSKEVILIVDWESALCR